MRDMAVWMGTDSIKCALTETRQLCSGLARVFTHSMFEVARRCSTIKGRVPPATMLDCPCAAAKLVFPDSV